MKHRKKLLIKITNDAKIKKIAEDILNDDSISSEEDAQIYADKVFVKMVNDIVNSINIDELDN